MAPFVLLHLGRPDNITIYALEHKEVSMTQKAALVLEIGGAIYGSYKQRFMRLCAPPSSSCSSWAPTSTWRGQLRYGELPLTTFAVQQPGERSYGASHLRTKAVGRLTMTLCLMLTALSVSPWVPSLTIKSTVGGMSHLILAGRM